MTIQIQEFTRKGECNQWWSEKSQYSWGEEVLIEKKNKKNQTEILELDNTICRIKNNVWVTLETEWILQGKKKKNHKS